MRHLPENYINREMSWLEFNQRVLDMADLAEVPLLERVKFLAITGSNLDEFFKVRVGGLKLAYVNNVDSRDISGMSVSEQLTAITGRVREMNSSQADIYQEGLMPQLESHGIKRIKLRDLSEQQKQHLGEIFDREISAIISPIAIERDQPFPLLAGTRLCVCVHLRTTAQQTLGEFGDDDTNDRFVVIPIRGSVRRFISVPQGDGYAYVLVENVIQLFLSKLFPGQQIVESSCFRITRNADIAVNEDTLHDLLHEMTELLEARKVSRIVRLEVDSSTGQAMLEFLKEATQVGDQEVFPVDCPLDLSAFFELASTPGFPELKDESWAPQPSPDFADGANIFDTIASADRLLIHPYQQYDPVIEFLNAAADDPDVIAIKQTLYRTSGNSKVIEALIEAANNGTEFLSKAQVALGHPISIISGHEEARLVYLGAAFGLAVGDKRRLVVDIGGGSTEIIIGSG